MFTEVFILSIWLLLEDNCFQNDIDSVPSKVVIKLYIFIFKL